MHKQLFVPKNNRGDSLMKRHLGRKEGREGGERERFILDPKD